MLLWPEKPGKECYFDTLVFYSGILALVVSTSGIVAIFSWMNVEFYVFQIIIVNILVSHVEKR